MPAINPVNGRPLPNDAIQRILFVCPSVKLFGIGSVTTTKGYNLRALANNEKNKITDIRLRVIETAIPNPKAPSGESLSAAVVLEDCKTGELFAAAPYTRKGVVEQALDGSRFFAIIVQSPNGRKVTLGIEFGATEASLAFDFNVTLQELRRTLNIEVGPESLKRQPRTEDTQMGKRDFSLKEGEMITVDIGGSKAKGRRSNAVSLKTKGSNSEDRLGGFALQPPPKGGFFPPPPSAEAIRAQNRSYQTNMPSEEQNIADMGFDDGEFGEFQ